MNDSDLRRSLSCTRVWGILLAPEYLESWVTLHAVFLAEVGIFCAVNLGQLDVLLLQCGRSLLVLGCKCFAMSTIRY